MAISSSQKVLFMGLGASGKSSIRSVVFEGKDATDVADYAATINYTRSSKSLIGTAFQVFDCGGQESFINNFIGDQAEFIFSDVKILVWVVDVANFDQVSTSKFYFDHAIEKLNTYSSGAVVFCLCHKIDLVLADMREELLQTMRQFFAPPIPTEISYAGTSIFDHSVFKVFGEIIRTLMGQSTKAKSVSEALQEFITQTEELSGVTVYTDEGLPVFEEGTTDMIVVPANLWLSSSDRLSDEFGTQNTLKSIVETDDYVFVFQNMKNKLLLTGVAKKVAPLNFVLVKMEELANIVNELLYQHLKHGSNCF
ncbi:MAG: ADP-ribosylation factor-like protein [Candidatus Heimdallarchaeota archaeon]